MLGIGGGGYWYLNAYTVLMLLSPVLNAGCEMILKSCDNGLRKTAIVAFLILLLWSWCQETIGLRKIAPQVTAVSTLSFLTLVYIYLIGRWLNITQFAVKPNGRMVACALVCWALMPVFGNFVFPGVMFLCLIMFRLFERLAIPTSAGRVILLVVPSLFPVYLLHTNSFGLDFIHQFVQKSINYGAPRYVSYVTCTVIVFLGAAVLDIPRRAAVRLVAKRGFQK